MLRFCTTILILAMLALCGFTLAGCAAHPVLHGGGALAYIDAAKPHTDTEGKGLLDKASGEVRKDESSAITTAQALDVERRETARLKQALADEKGHWIGYQLRLAGKTIAIIAALAWVGLGIAGAVLPAGGIGSTIIRLLPLANVFAVVRDKFVQPVAPAPAPGV